MSFGDDLKKFVVNIKNTSEERVRRIGFATFQKVNEKSPVDEGTFRANWNMSIGTPDRTVDMNKRIPDVSNAGAVIAGHKLGQDIYITNSVPYAQKLENGYSRQAPNGIMEPTLTVIKNAIAGGNL